MESIKQMNWKLIVMSVAVFLGGSVVPGCISHFVPVRSPTGSVERGIPEKMTVASAPAILKRHVAEENAFVEEFNSNIEDGQATVAMVGGVVDLATSPEGLASFMNPVSGGMALLGLFGGSKLKRRQDYTPDQYRQGKEESFNKGQEIRKIIIGIDPSTKEPTDAV